MRSVKVYLLVIYLTTNIVDYHDASKDLKRHFKIVTLETPPFMMKRNISSSDGNQASSIEWYGYCMDFFNELIKHLPYEVTYEIYQVADNKFGTKTKHISFEGRPLTRKVTESWNGLVGDLEKGMANIALAPLAVMAERELVIDFTVPFYDLVGIQILLKKPEVPQDLFKFLTVLDNEVWLSIAVAYFVTSFVMFLFDRLSPYSHKNATRIKKFREHRKTERDAARRAASKVNHPPQNFIHAWANSRSQVTPDDQSYGPLTKTLRSSEKRVHNQSTGPFSNLFGNGKELIYPVSSLDHDHKALNFGWSEQQRRVSRDYLNSIKLRKSIIPWEGEDATMDSDVDDGKPDFGIRDSLWFCITSLTPQGGGEAPQNLSGRIVAGAWWLFCFIVIASYTANLAAFLTVSRLDIPIENLDDLAKQYRIKYAPVDGTAENTYFERMAYIEEIFYNIWKQMSLNDSLSEEERSKFAVWDYPISDKYTKIWAHIQQVGMPQGIEAGIDRVRKSSLDDGFALLASANAVKHAVMTDCSLKAVGDEFSRKPIALGVTKGDTKLKDDLSYAILKLINQRYMEVLREKWWTNNPRRVVCNSNDDSEGISIENIGGVFIIIFTGVFLSFCVWTIERLVYSTKIGVSKEMIRKL